ncbi:MAG: RNA polymerase sigma factor [Parcubacteria group bacterium]|nr:RNA polymerase sigma factor [Parcubacteria group bacterium]
MSTEFLNTRHDENALLSPESAHAARSDEELLSASLKKPALFQELIGRYEDAFRRKVREVLGNRPEIDDILQETFVKIYLHGGKFQKQEGASFKSWAYKILLNTTFTFYQKLKKDDGALVYPEKEHYESFPDIPKGDLETSDFVVSVLSRMPAMLSRALKSHFILGVPQKEIATAENVSVSAIKTRIHRAKREFKKISAYLTRS